MTTRPGRNPFLAMAMLADRESWCWNMGCTTCGCHVFRHGIQELVKGVHPDSAQWTLHFDRGQFPEQFQGVPAAPSVAQQAILSAIVSQLHIEELMERCRFPNWLGYLGLVLQTTRQAEEKTKLLTHTLLPQLLAAVKDPDARSALKERFGGERLLGWEDLEEFERLF